MAKKSPYESGTLTDSIFLILLASLEPIHGYRIMQTVSQMTDGEVEIGPATMYTTLKKLKDAGWIQELGECDGKISYRITESGKAVLYQNHQKRKQMVEITEHVLSKEGK